MNELMNDDQRKAMWTRIKNNYPKVDVDKIKKIQEKSVVLKKIPVDERLALLQARREQHLDPYSGKILEPHED